MIRHFLVAETEGEHEVQVLHVGVVLDLQDVAPGVVPLEAEAALENKTAVGHLHVGMDGRPGAADDVGAVRQLVQLQSGGTPASAGVKADAPQWSRSVSSAVQIPLLAEAQVGKGAIQIVDRHFEARDAHVGLEAPLASRWRNQDAEKSNVSRIAMSTVAHVAYA